jgi:hypothetical protein
VHQQLRGVIDGGANMPTGAIIGLREGASGITNRPAGPHAPLGSV